MSTTWPQAVTVVGLSFLALVFVLYLVQSYLDSRKSALRAQHEGALRQLVTRYEQLAENTLDAQQRTAADVAELRARAGAIEQILRSVDD
ncbi:hypothetical protein [Actinokineospora sp. NBRC 105648]|uniref:hypothetical protein n=1 Tax=Actinokineospora sp. NBRC 105648 TaxID=3032206 RepID=UPI0024A575B3|nr:hypothetical protein [Actinokineospora sp. NBRC 105648]GLZ43750.1 hypothetical protein Acsp05_73740 [Actinokineospora sp. NBRC 105648]